MSRWKLTPEEKDAAFLQCEKCGGEESASIDSRPVREGRRRRRKCLECGHRFSTLEVRRADFDGLNERIRDLTEQLNALKL